MNKLKGREKKIQLTVSEAFTLLAHKTKEFTEIYNHNQKLWKEFTEIYTHNQKLWQDTKNTVVGGMIVLNVLQLIILFILILGKLL